jgi:Flp pilus assembly pilin Flp
MEWLTCSYVFLREWRKGQTMTEYALILSAVAVVVYIGYQTMGTTITGMINSIDTSL